jgi:hypothetical protein
MFSAQEVEYSSSGGAGGIVVLLIELVIAVVMVAAMWKIFVKAGEPGWAAIVPVYNIIVMVKIAGKPMWWVILYFIPIANIIASFIIAIAIAQRFGKSAGFGVGMVFLPFIFYPMLGFGAATAGPAPVPA